MFTHSVLQSACSSPHTSPDLSFHRRTHHLLTRLEPRGGERKNRVRTFRPLFSITFRVSSIQHSVTNNVDVAFFKNSTCWSTFWRHHNRDWLKWNVCCLFVPRWKDKQISRCGCLVMGFLNQSPKWMLQCCSCCSECHNPIIIKINYMSYCCSKIIL